MSNDNLLQELKYVRPKINNKAIKGVHGGKWS